MSAEIKPPAELEEYRLAHPLGRGAMGQVYLAHDTLLDRPVAIKFIAGHVDPAARDRFLVEARAIARLSHPNVVAIYRVGEVRGRPFLVSELVRGTSLDRLERPLPPTQLLEIAIGLARGLGAAHRNGVLHRDLKPANAMLAEDGTVKLLDFGLAKLLVKHDAPLPPAPPAPPDADPPGADPPSADPPDADPLGATAALVAATAPASHRPPRPPAAPAAPAPERRVAASPWSELWRRSDAGSSPALTQAGEALGSPLYMAPEVWRGEPATQASDIYSLGVLLYELAAGCAPYHGLGYDELRRAMLASDLPAPPLSESAPEVPAPLCALIDRCLLRDPAARPPSGDAVREALERLHYLGRAAVIPAGNPYRGLHAFESSHRGLFFGRGADVRAAIDRLREATLLLVCGDSGVGKSSLCRAGVLPLLGEGALDPAREARLCTLVPGVRPLHALCAALSLALSPEVETSRPGAALHELLVREGPEELSRAVRRALPREALLVLFIDQLEEALTLAAPAEAGAFGEALRALLPVARVLATVRSDFLGRLASLPGLGERVTGALHLLRPLTDAGLREAIEEPAAALGYTLETPEMVGALVEAGRAPGALPLLQFTLAALWEARDPRRQVLTERALRDLGGPGALARHADGVLERLLPAQRAQARRLLLLLVTAAGTRARRTREELISPGEGGEVLEALVQGRLVSARQTEDEDPGYELSHEALLQSWGTLRGWLARDAAGRAARERLERAALEWERLGRGSEGLWQPLQLAEVATLPASSPRERQFLRASRRSAQRRRLVRGLSLLSLLLLPLLILGAVKLQQRRLSARLLADHLEAARRQLGEARQQDQAALQLRAAAFLRFDDRGAAPLPGAEEQRRRAEADWAAALRGEAQADKGYASANRTLEAALLVADWRSDVRRLLAEVLYQQALLAERGRQLARRDELMLRLRNYDPDGQFTRRAEAPARLSLRTVPPGAEVVLRRYQDQGGYRALSPEEPLGRAPLPALSLAPGSVLLLLADPRATAGAARPVVRYPLLLDRGEELSLEVPLPAQVPTGYVYVPPGRFLSGNGDDETLRRDFLQMAPLHEARTAGYVIGRTEVTFADWLEYLRALPPDERARRLPMARGFSGGSLSLREEGGWFWLTMQPTAQAYTAREGQRLRYPDRAAHAEADWRRFPVAGISFEDAQAYAAWLSRSGRLPGARLCSEAEWERAARGADDRRYPSGDRLEPDDANYAETYGRRPLGFGPDEVGWHPRGESPFGVLDLAGNVWEWVRGPRDGIFFRGGCFYQETASNRSDNHEPGEATLRVAHIGLRVCADW